MSFHVIEKIWNMLRGGGSFNCLRSISVDNENGPRFPLGFQAQTGYTTQWYLIVNLNAFEGNYFFCNTMQIIRRFISSPYWRGSSCRVEDKDGAPPELLHFLPETTASVGMLFPHIPSCSSVALSLGLLVLSACRMLLPVFVQQSAFSANSGVCISGFPAFLNQNVVKTPSRKA